MTRPTYLRLHLESNDDEEITCLFCGLRHCEQATMVKGGGRMSIIGVHTKCAESHMESLSKVKKEPE